MILCSSKRDCGNRGACAQKDLRRGSILRDIVNFPSELRRRRSGMFGEFAPNMFMKVARSRLVKTVLGSRTFGAA